MELDTELGWQAMPIAYTTSKWKPQSQATACYTFTKIYSYMRLNQAAMLPYTTIKDHFWILYASLRSGWAITTSRLLCYNGTKCLFDEHNDTSPSSGIKSEVHNFSITIPTLYQRYYIAVEIEI